MPTVEKTHGGQVYIRSVGKRFSIGDRADVDEAEAAYLTEERGDFEIIEGDELSEAEVDEDEIVDTLEEGAEICGAEKSDGETCERPADDCPYHGED